MANAMVLTRIPFAHLVCPMRRSRRDGRRQRGEGREGDDAGQKKLLDFHDVLSKQVPEGCAISMTQMRERSAPVCRRPLCVERPKALI